MNSLFVIPAVIFSITSPIAFYISVSLGFGEFVAEGIPFAFGQIMLLSIAIRAGARRASRGEFYVGLTIVLYLLFITSINHISVQKPVWYSYIFLYAFIPLIYLPFLLSSHHQSWASSNTVEFFLRLYVFLIAASAVYGVAQMFQIDASIPPDGTRSRGLMRSTLNFSTLCLIGGAALHLTRYSKILKYCLGVTLFLGLIVAQSRGALISFLLIFLSAFIRQNGVQGLVTMRAFSFCLLLAVTVAWGVQGDLYFLSRYTDTNLTSGGDQDRLNLYSSFFDYFVFWGGGLGSTGSAAGRFGEMIAFESYILNVFYQAGVIFFVIILFVYQLASRGMFSGKTFDIILGFGFCSLVQQTFETPSLNTAAWIILLLSVLRNSRRIPTQ